MARNDVDEERRVRMSGDYNRDDLVLTRAVIHEGLSKLTEMTVEFMCPKANVNLKEIVGKDMRVHLRTENGEDRVFSGLCVSAETADSNDSFSLFTAQVRPWFWMLTRAFNCRIFQEKSAVDIIEEVLNDRGLSDFENKLTDDYVKRTYCVQYRETDYDFLCRLMEEEGIYFYFKNELGSTSKEKLVLCDSISAHDKVPGHSSIKYFPRHGGQEETVRREDLIDEWVENERITTGAVRLTEFDFFNPPENWEVVEKMEKGDHQYNDYERYDYPGHHRLEADSGNRNDLGTKRAQVRVEAEAIQHKRYKGRANVRAWAVGQTFSLTDHKEDKNNKDYLISEVRHYVQDVQHFEQSGVNEIQTVMRQDFPDDLSDRSYGCNFEVVPKSEPYRAPLVTPWPEISGLHTATVVGESGEEISTDEFGRIKVKFHWDRDAKKDETSSCWVRVVTPWSGTGWGMVALPRIGQEVVIQFEEGDPDRPICTGMLYNKPQKPAFNYPDDATQLGIRTRSSKGGGEKEYNELMFEDKKGQEFMRVQAQKDHQQLIKNKSVVTIGQDEVDAGAHDDEGSLSEVIRNNVTRTIQEGSHYYTIEQGDEEFKIETGSQTIDIKTDKTQTIEGKHTKTITGNDATTVKSGNMTVDVKSGKITMTAAQKIELKVGSSSVVIDQVGVTIKGTMLKFEGKAMAELKSKLTTVKGDGMLTAKGGITMIN